MVAASLLFLSVLWSYDIFMRPVYSVSPAPALARRLIDLGMEGTPVETVGVRDKYVSQLRVLSRGAIWPVMRGPSGPGSDDEPTLILREPQKAEWEERGYRLEECGFSYRRIRARDIWQAIRGNKDGLKAKRIPYSLAVRSDSS
jgi:hypothetical protein